MSKDRYLALGYKNLNLVRPLRIDRQTCKPYGCLWACKWKGIEEISDWYDWVSEEMPEHCKNYGILLDISNLNIYRVDSQQDLLNLHENFGEILEVFKGDIVNIKFYWKLIAEKYDGIEFTGKFYYSLDADVLGLNCPSLCIFNHKKIENFEYIEWKNKCQE